MNVGYKYNEVINFMNYNILMPTTSNVFFFLWLINVDILFGKLSLYQNEIIFGLII